MNKNIVLLIIGALLSLLMIIFCNDIYPSLSGRFFDSEFDNAMYDNNFYLYVMLVNVLGAWIAAAVFYYVINSVSFSRWYHWLVVQFVISLVVAVLAYFLPEGTLYDEDYDFDTQLWHFALLNFAVEFVMYVVASFSVRWWSSNCRHTPIPE